MRGPLPVSWFGSRSIVVHRRGKEPQACYLPGLVLVDAAFRARLEAAKERAKELHYLLGLPDEEPSCG